MYSRKGNISGNQYNPIKGSPSPLTQCLGINKYFLLNPTSVEAIWISIGGGETLFQMADIVIKNTSSWILSSNMGPRVFSLCAIV